MTTWAESPRWTDGAEADVPKNTISNKSNPFLEKLPQTHWNNGLVGMWTLFYRISNHQRTPILYPKEVRRTSL